MSLYDYQVSIQIAIHNYPFYALIQAAMRQADTDNLELLKTAFPEVYAEFRARYNAPGGRLAGDPEE
jgi:hypothetical protein